MKLKGKKKAAFLRRMRLGRLRAARGTKPRKRTARKAPARRKSAARKRTYVTARPIRRRKKATPESVLGAMFRTALPATIGIVLAGLLARSVPQAKTAGARAGMTGIVSVLLVLAASWVAKTIPLKLVSPGVVKGVAGGMFIDALFRGTTKLRAGMTRLPAAAKRPGGLLAGTRAQHRSVDERVALANINN